MKASLRSCAVLAFVWITSLSGLAHAQPLYEFTLVDSFNPGYGLRETYLWDINDQGLACGITTKDGAFGYPGIVWNERDEKTVVPVSYPHGVNNTGLVVGNLSVFNVFTGQSWSPPTLPGTYIGPFFGGVNDAGVAVGAIQTCNCSNSGGVQQIPYVWDAAGGARTIAVPGAKGLSRINNAGVAIGWTGGNSSLDGFFIDLASGAYTTLESVFPATIGFGPTRAFDINDHGLIVGTRYGTFPVYFYGYMYAPSDGVTVLPFPGDPYQQAVKPFGINNAGTIVGEIYINGSSRAFVYSATKGVRDLNDATLVAGIPSGYTMMTAQKINNVGWIVGYGYGGGGMYKSYVLKPRGSGCPADFNADGFVTGDDFDAYVSAFETGTASADFDHDGFVTGDDFDRYVVAFQGGC